METNKLSYNFKSFTNIKKEKEKNPYLMNYLRYKYEYILG